MLKDAGLNVQVGGNIGTALISMVESSRDDGWNVVELSSFQLETIVDFHPTVAAVLNVTPNHMDRYEDLLDYAAAKHRIFMNQTAGDVAILNADDEIVSSWAGGLRAHVVQFSVQRELERRNVSARPRPGFENRGWRARGDDARRFATAGHAQRRERAGRTGRRFGMRRRAGIFARNGRNFHPVEHRLEEVAEINGVRFFNDSKATSVDATIKALEAFADDAGKVVLILGGLGKKRRMRRWHRS